MRTIGPDPNSVRIFVQVVDSGSFTRAALVLGMPKSTVSDRVGELEAQLGVSLLIRTTRKLRLTDAGAEYFARAKFALAQLQAANDQASQAQRRPMGALRITAPADLANPEFLWAVAKYRMAFPEVTVEFNFNNRDVDLVAEGYDIGIRGGSLGDSTMIAKKLGESYMILIAGPEYLKKAPPLRNPEDLDLHNQVHMNDPSLEPATWDLFASEGRAARVRLAKAGISTNSFFAIKTLVAQGSGIAIVPHALCKSEIANQSIVRLLPEWTTQKIPLYLVYPARKYPSPKVSEFVVILERETAALFG